MSEKIANIRDWFPKDQILSLALHDVAVFTDRFRIITLMEDHVNGVWMLFMDDPVGCDPFKWESRVQALQEIHRLIEADELDLDAHDRFRRRFHQLSDLKDL